MELEFTLDKNDRWTTHEVAAVREGFQTAKQKITYTDRPTSYTLNLEPMKKDLSISSKPDGAEIYLDDQPLGAAPVTVKQQPFAFDVEAHQYLPHKIKAVKPGYPTVEKQISWDVGQTEYSIDLKALSKTARIIPNPPDAKVTLDGVELKKDGDGAYSAPLEFTPMDEKGTLKTYTVNVSKTAPDSEWEPAKFTISYDQGKTNYPVALKEILTRPIDLLSADPQHIEQGWQMVPKHTSTIAMKSASEGQGKPIASRVASSSAFEQIDSFSVSPDGSTILFSVLMPDKSNLRSQLRAVRGDGGGGLQQLTDGRALEIQPSYTPDGSQIVFTSNRGSARLSVWTMSSNGTSGVTNITPGDSTDLWPTIDSDPKPRLFYVRLIDSRPDPRLYMTRLGSTIRTDLTSIAGMQPRVSPKGDAVLFTSINEKTGKRDIYRMSDRGGLPENLTNSPDADDFDPAWSQDATHIAFASDRAKSGTEAKNFDIWVMSADNPNQPIQVTGNQSWDDCPQFDPTGRAIYFRSNRTAQWGIWKIPFSSTASPNLAKGATDDSAAPASLRVNPEK
jgi:Tol biopolymer transport system component